MFIWTILFPGYFSTDLKGVRNTTFFTELLFSLPYKQVWPKQSFGKREDTETTKRGLREMLAFPNFPF